MVTRLKSSKLHHSQAYIVEAQINEPRTTSEATADPLWLQAMQSEFKALKRNLTWTLVPASSNQHVVDHKWVFKKKLKADGSLLKLKARWVAKGFQQTLGVDFSETFSPVIKATTIRVVPALAISFGWRIHQVDVDNAFLNEDLQEEVFMTQCQGFIDCLHPDFVCKLCMA